MAVIKTKKGYKNTKTGKYYSSQSAAISASKSSSSGSSSSKVVNAITGTQSEMLENAQKQLAALSSALSEPSTKLTSAEVDKLYNQLSSASSSLPKAPAPTNAAAVPAPVPAPVIPDVPFPSGNPTDAMAGVAGLSTYNSSSIANIEAMIKQNAENAAKRAEEQQKENVSLFERWFGKDGKDAPSPNETRTDAWDETGMDVKDYFARQEAGIKEIETLNEQYNAIVAARDQQIAQTRDAMGSMNFINNQTAQITRNAAPELARLSANINSKAATLEAQQGNFAEAQKYVNQAVQDAISEAKYRYDMFSAYYDMNKDTFNRTEQVYSDAFSSMLELAKMDYEQLQAEKEAVGEMMLKYTNAGISITDSYEEALRKASKVAGTSVASTEALRRAKMVLNGQAALTDYTTAEQAAIKDAIWSLSPADMGYVNAPMSYLPGESPEAKFEALRMSVAGPGTGTKVEPIGELTSAQASAALTWLYSNGDMEDVALFQTDPDFRAWAYEQSQI